jgi:histidinol-phosphate/aromatic aminotransferase/cobyric acid decarboxylase-like protein
MVPLFDLTRQYQGLKSQIDGAVLDLLESGRFVLGPAVEEFEAAAAHYLNVKHAIGVANGTDALLLSLRSLGLKAGDEVITTPFTFIATAEVISLLALRRSSSILSRILSTLIKASLRLSLRRAHAALFLCICSDIPRRWTRLMA